MGPITSAEDWPRPLKTLIHDSPAIEIDASTVQAHCLCNGLDLECVWRMSADPETSSQLVELWKLTKVEDPQWHVLDGQSGISGEPTPSWWSPKRDGETLFFVCPQTLAGDKGNRFQVAVDNEQETVFVHYWFNF